MPLATTSTWYQANSSYLFLAAEQVHQVLKSYLAQRQNQPPEPAPDLHCALDATVAAMSEPPALDHLCTTFNLSPFERDILLLCVAHAIIPDFPDLCAQAQGKAQMDYPTFGLALQALPQPQHRPSSTGNCCKLNLIAPSPCPPCKSTPASCTT